MTRQQSDLVAGGYLITRPVTRPAQLSGELLPDTVLSASPCLCCFVPDVWALTWSGVADESRAQSADALALADRVEEVASWVASRFDEGHIGWPNVIHSLDVAREVSERFLSDVPDLAILGIGLTASHADRLLAEHPPSEGEGIPGLYTQLGKRSALADGGETLGWEPLCYEHGDLCSWLCNGLEVPVHEELCIRPNGHGFIEDPEQARAAADYCALDGAGAEPGLWQPWLLVRY